MTAKNLIEQLRSEGVSEIEKHQKVSEFLMQTAQMTIEEKETVRPQSAMHQLQRPKSIRSPKQIYQAPSVLDWQKHPHRRGFSGKRKIMPAVSKRSGSSTKQTSEERHMTWSNS